jgi:phosphatidylserine/phosphatidylglycerophosphate/cardiolipin synthase-like enzyme
MEAITVIGACVLGASVAGYVAYKKYYNSEETKTESNEDGPKNNEIQIPKEPIIEDKVKNNVIYIEKEVPPKVKINIGYAFSKAKQRPEQKLMEVIDNAKSKLDIAIYTITDEIIVDRIISASNRGVKVRIITDYDMSKNIPKNQWQRKVLRMMDNCGIPIKINKYNGFMHLKVTIADDLIVTTGSYNYSKAARTKNAEILVVIDNEKTAKEWATEFESMWNDWENYIEYAQLDSIRTTA